MPVTNTLPVLSDVACHVVSPLKLHAKFRAQAFVSPTNERDVMRAFWHEHSAQPSMESMMLDSKASEIDIEERPEVCQGRVLC